MKSPPALRIVIVAPDSLHPDPSDDAAMVEVERSRSLRIGLLQHGYNIDMAVLMALNHNGQAISLSKALADKSAVYGPSLAKLMAKEKREYTFAGTFPTGTHAM